MTWRLWLALPMRWFVPLLLALLALASMVVIYHFQVREYREQVELQERWRLLERMALEQTRLEVQLGQDNHLQVRRLVSSLGLYSGITRAWLVDGKGRIQAALSRLQVGRPLAEILEDESPALRQAVRQTLDDRETAIHIHAVPGEEALLGHVAIAPDRYLFLRVDLAQPLAARRYAGREEIWREAGTTLSFAVLLAVLLHVLWFRRATRLTTAIAALGAGRMETRAGLAGRDELAAIGAAIDRMAAELQERQAQLQRLASLIERSPVIAIAWRNEPGWPVSFVGDNLAEWGLAPEEFRTGRRKYADLIHPEDRPRIEAEVAEHLLRGPDRYTQEYRLRQSDGEWLWIEDRTRLIRAADGAVTEIEGVLLDVSENRRLREAQRQSEARYRTMVEEQVRQRTAELAAANKELEMFSYSVSHDLKAPLRGIDGYSQLLLADYGDRLDEEGRLFLSNVRQGVAQMNQLIEDLLAYSRMERRSLDPVSLSLEQEVRKVLDERKADIASRGMEVEMAVRGLTAQADPNGLTLVLRNLLDNALKFTRDSHPPRLAIHGHCTGESTILTFQDNGIGFDMRFHDRLFEIFQRLQRAEDYPGTGVGLAIARKAMQRMGGRVWADSAPGQGAAFHLELRR
jgi:PAS domain S-box-containing protein